MSFFHGVLNQGSDVLCLGRTQNNVRASRKPQRENQGRELLVKVPLVYLFFSESGSATWYLAFTAFTMAVSSSMVQEVERS